MTLKIAIDTFNRFRRPNAEARLISLSNNLAVIEFRGEKEKMDFYVSAFAEELGDVQVKSVEKNGTCRVTFLVRSESREENDLESALRILNRYNEGIEKQSYSFED